MIRRLYGAINTGVTDAHHVKLFDMFVLRVCVFCSLVYRESNMQVRLKSELSEVFELKTVWNRERFYLQI